MSARHSTVVALVFFLRSGAAASGDAFAYTSAAGLHGLAGGPKCSVTVSSTEWAAPARAPPAVGAPGGLPANVVASSPSPPTLPSPPSPRRGSGTRSACALELRPKETSRTLPPAKARGAPPPSPPAALCPSRACVGRSGGAGVRSARKARGAARRPPAAAPDPVSNPLLSCGSRVAGSGSTPRGLW